MKLRPNQLVLVGLLAEQPAHPYAIYQAIQARQLDRWAVVAFSSAYQILRQLEVKGVVTSRETETVSGPKRREYTLTDQGRAIFMTHLRTVLGEFSDQRSQLELAMMFRDHVQLAELEQLLRSRRQATAQARRELASRQAQIVDAKENAVLVYDYSRFQLDADLAFLDHALMILTEGESDAGPQPTD